VQGGDTLRADDVVWAMGSLCALHRKPFDATLLLNQFPPPFKLSVLIEAPRALGFKVKQENTPVHQIRQLHLPCVVLLRTTVAPAASPAQAAQVAPVPKAANDSVLPEPEAPESEAPPEPDRPAIVVQADDDQIVLFEAGTNTPRKLNTAEFSARYTGTALQIAPASQAISDPDQAAGGKPAFGYRWFLVELLKHRRVWRDILLASLVIQLLALATPLFTQVVIDKVVVHRTESTLIVIAIGLAVFMFFSALLTWVRQYLLLHTGNRVDAVLGSAVFEHLLKLPPAYYEHRPTGVIAARLHGVETIRDFLASAAVTLVLDLPFLVIFAAIMFYYSVFLTLVSLAIISVIVLMSLVAAPVFRAQLNEQFLLGARNQAFTTEYIAGIETVKSLQMEPQLKARYGDYLADYLRAGFAVRQIGNSYNVAANGLEQLMTLLILVLGAWQVMHSSDFTVGMLVAFQMFASRLSQPMLRLVGLWQQFQQANLSVARLGDVMNAPAEPYSLVPTRRGQGQGRIEIEALAFRYSEQLPYLYQDFNLTVQPGQVMAIMGPSGSGKSTLTKLLQGFYLPSSGTIRIDGTDLRHLSANELRSNFGVVPQETMLFSGTLYDNLQMANPQASFEDIVQACRMAEIHDFVEKLPKGYQTEIGERGVGLSGGQKQRISIARALIKKPKILIFDEATSSLDAQTAEHFAATINQLKGKVTMLFITHAMPRGLKVDEVVRIGLGSLSAVAGEHKDATPRVESTGVVRDGLI
jgi:subfamily B ATP-binding cassette protein HlyB/CyaB